MSIQPPPTRRPAPARSPDLDAEHAREEKQLFKSVVTDVPGWLARLYAPIIPYLKRIHITRDMPRKPNPADILLPKGYVAEVVATELNAPVHICFDDRGNGYVTESGHKVDSPPRILKVNLETGERQVHFEFPEDRWMKTGAVTGACFHAGYLYVMNTDTLSRIHPDGTFEDIVTGLPGRGDHQANHPAVGPDGKIYFGVGSATNCGVVGPDNFGYEWLATYPTVHDVPGQATRLAGRNFGSPNVLMPGSPEARTGAYQPFGQVSLEGEVIEGDVKCTGAVVRCDPDGSNLELVAWGLRNPYGIAFHPDGRLFVTEHGMDNRGARYVVGDYDDFYEIHEGEWYGWPDYASGIRLDDPYWGKGGKNREPVIADPPNPAPPRPFLSFEPHAAANGFDFSRHDGFGFAGDAFVSLFGALVPLTTPRMITPAGFKVVRVDMANGRCVDFAVNRIAGPASKLPHGGFERPSHCAFGPDGSLYVVDWGQIAIAPELGGIRMPSRSGMLWRIRRTEEPAGELPPRPLVVPLYGLQALALVLGAVAAVGAVAGVAWLTGRGLRKLRTKGRRTPKRWL